MTSHREVLNELLVTTEEPAPGQVEVRIFHIWTQERQDALKWALGMLDEAGEEFLEFKEALDDVRSLRREYVDLNGGGPGWGNRNYAAWAKADELFADEDEVAYNRQQEDAHG